MVGDHLFIIVLYLFQEFGLLIAALLLVHFVNVCLCLFWVSLRTFKSKGILHLVEVKYYSIRVLV